MKDLARVIACIALAVGLMSCSSSPPKPEEKDFIDVARVLKQVNDAVEASIDPKDKDFPAVSSVTLDLQVTVDTAVSSSSNLPVPVITAGFKVDKQNLHHITLTFVPTPPREPANAPESGGKGRLASAIRAVYNSVSHAGGNYKFQNGTITLQCIFKVELDAGASVMGLVPLSADASAANETIQSITLNFGNDPKKSSAVSAPPKS